MTRRLGTSSRVLTWLRPALSALHNRCSTGRSPTGGRRCGLPGHVVRRLWGCRRVDDDVPRTWAKRDAEGARGLREEAWDKRAADGGDCEK